MILVAPSAPNVCVEVGITVRSWKPGKERRPRAHVSEAGINGLGRGLGGGTASGREKGRGEGAGAKGLTLPR